MLSPLVLSSLSPLPLLRELGSPTQRMVLPTVGKSAAINIEIIPTGHPNIDSPSFKTLFLGKS